MYQPIEGIQPVFKRIGINAQVETRKIEQDESLEKISELENRMKETLQKIDRRVTKDIGALTSGDTLTRVYVKLIIDLWIDHLQDNNMGRNPNTLVHILGALHSRSGVAIRHVLRKLQSSPDV
jgi:tetrahydromethanopterin S-methyltransferase subunit G